MEGESGLWAVFWGLYTVAEVPRYKHPARSPNLESSARVSSLSPRESNLRRQDSVKASSLGCGILQTYRRA